MATKQIIPDIPGGLVGDTLITTINDRLRMIQNFTQTTTATAPPPTTVITAPAAPAAASGASITFAYIALKSGANNIPSPGGSPAAGSMYILYLDEPSGGGGTITWDPIFEGVQSDDIDTRSNHAGRYVFAWNKTIKQWSIMAMLLGREQ